MKRSFAIVNALTVLFTILVVGQPLYAQVKPQPRTPQRLGAAAPSPACCSVTSIDSGNGIVTAKDTATGATFQFKVTSAALLATLHPGSPVYANFPAKQVSLDGSTVCCTITSGPSAPPPPPAAPPAPPPAAAPAPNPAPAPPVTLPPTPRQPQATPSAPQIATTPAPSPAAAPAPAPCCTITAINVATGIVTAIVNATGKTFQFQVTDSALLKSLKIGQGVYANFVTHRVSLDGSTVCCVITSGPSAPEPAAPAAHPAPALATSPKNVPPTPIGRPAGQHVPVPLAPVGPQIVFFRTDPSQTGGLEAHGHVELSQAVPIFQTGGVRIVLSSSVAALIQFPQGDAVVQPGFSGTDFNFLSTPVSIPTEVQMYASVAGVSRKISVFTILPTILKGISVSPNTLPGGMPAIGTLTFTGPPPSTGAVVVQLTSSNPAVLGVDPTATLPANRTQVQFHLSATKPEVQTPVTVTASYSPQQYRLQSKDSPGKIGNLHSMSYSSSVTVVATSIASNAACTYPCIGATIDVTLPSPAPAGGEKMFFSGVDNSMSFTYGDTLTIPAGQTTGSIKYDYAGTPLIGQTSYTPEQWHSIFTGRPVPHYLYSRAGTLYSGDVTMLEEVRPDLYVWKIVLTDRFSNDITSSGPTDGEPFTMCANISAVGDYDSWSSAWMTDQPTLNYSPTVLHVVFLNVRGAGHEFYFPVDFNGSLTTNSPCMPVPGIAAVNGSYNLSLTIDPDHTINEEFYDNNTRNFTIVRKQ